MPRNGIYNIKRRFEPAKILEKAVEMLQVAEGKLEAHEYLNALKTGELYESVAFAEQFAKYKARYAFPEEIEKV